MSTNSLLPEKSKQPVQLAKPEKPADDDCCGGGACCPCVWDDYFAKLDAWQAQQTTKVSD